MKQKILYFDKVFDDFKAILEAHCPSQFHLLYWDQLDESSKEEQIGLADYLLVATKKLDQEILSKAKSARYIQKTGIGVDNIDLRAASALGFPVANTPGGNASGVAELTILLILALYRKLPQINRATKEGQWLMWELRPSSYEMQGKTHGFVGFGNIGREVARRSRAFGTNIVYYDKFRVSREFEEELDAQYLSLEEVLKTSDIISLHIPLLPDTKGIIGMNELKLMKKNAVLINVSRGGTVDEEALYHALKDRLIAGAGIDVWEKEPVNPEHPLLTLEQVIASPHIGAGTKDTLDRVLKIAFDNIERVAKGENPQFVVNHISQPKTN